WSTQKYSHQMVQGYQQRHDCWLVSAIILNWNSVKHTCECLQSLSQQTYPGDKLEVIVVDNGSIEDPAPVETALKQYQQAKRWNQAKLVSLPSNVGVPGGYNVGLEHTSPYAQVFLRLDNDVVLDTHYLQYGVEAMA